MASNDWVIVGCVSNVVSHLDIHIIDIIIFVTARVITELETFLLLQMILLLLFIMIQLGLGQACELSLGVSQKRS